MVPFLLTNAVTAANAILDETATPALTACARPFSIVDANGALVGTLVPAGDRRFRLRPPVPASSEGEAARSDRSAFGPDYSHALSPNQSEAAYASWVVQAFAIDHD